MTIRKLEAGEVIPFKHGLEPLQLDPNWAWVAIEGKQIVGLFLAAPCHGAAFIVRLVKGPNAPVGWVRKVTRQAAKDMVAAGYVMAFTYLNVDNLEEVRLLKLISHVSTENRLGLLEFNHRVCGFSLEDWSNI